MLDRRLSFDCHATSVARACNHHVQAIRHIRRLLTTELALTVACSLTLSRLDYCNDVFLGAPTSSIQKLQRVQNTTASVVLQSARRSPSQPLTPPGAALAPGSTTDLLQAGRPDIEDPLHLHHGLPQPPHPACHRH